MGNPYLAVVADDLTGANDTGAQFSQQGARTVILPDADRLTKLPEADVVVVSTNSRAVPRDAAADRVRRATARLRDAGIPHFYKKIDSLLRGQPGPELAAMQDALGVELAVAAPAFPANGRVTAGGFQLVDGLPIGASEARHDPSTPVAESYVPRLFARSTGRPVGLVDLETVAAGAGAVVSALAANRARGERIVVADATTPEHLAAIARALPVAGAARLCAGTAGLAGWLLPAFGLSPPTAPVLTVVGSRSTVARRQLAVLAEETGALIVTVDHAVSGTHDGSVPGATVAAARVELAIRAGQDVVLTTHLDSLEPVAADAAAVIQVALGGVVATVLANGAVPGGIVATGGDTALAVCSAIGVDYLVTGAEVLPGIPVARAWGGATDGLRLVTKAGSFGPPTALVEAVRALKRAVTADRKGATG